MIAFNNTQLANLSTTTTLLFHQSTALFWSMLPVMLLIAMLTLYVSGEMTGGKLEGLFRRLIIAIAALVAFPEISRTIQGVEGHLVSIFGGDDVLTQVFSKLGDKASQIKEEGSLSWIKLGQMGLNIITTLSFLILALVRHFLDMLHLSLWNVMHVLAPLAFLGCLFPSWAQVPKGILTGMIELSLWKPLWVVLARILISVGFGEEPKDVSQWFDTAVLNFAVAGLMASTPVLVHSLLGGTIASFGGSLIQTMASGAGAVLTASPMRMIQSGARWTSSALKQGSNSILRSASPRNNNFSNHQRK